jgi:signal transduction histidine kinase
VLTLTQTTAAILALFCGAWLAVAAWVTLRGGARANAATAETVGAERRKALLNASPALPVVILQDGQLEPCSGLAPLVGLNLLPLTLSGLSDAPQGLDAEDLGTLTTHVLNAASTGAGFEMTAKVLASSRLLRILGAPAPQPWPQGAVLLWFYDATSSEERIATLEGQVARSESALDSLSALIEAAPFPMWHRGPDLSLTLVNSAYVRAVEAESGLAVVEGGIELVEEAPRALAETAREGGAPVSRDLPATVAGERRVMRIVEVPLGEGGVAGYAIDVEDQEQARSDLGRFVTAQRDMLDRLSAGVAQFGRDHALTFFNQPFARTFALQSDFLADAPEFNRVLDAMRETGSLPEVRDYPAWKAERGRWFTSGLAADEEDWLLPGGRHLRVVAQPLPDGGLLLIFEDRTEQLQLASARDTLLRVRTATFDNLFEAVGVFAADGRLNLWNNRFRELWEFDEETLAAHPRVDALTPHIGRKLKNRNHAGLMRELVRSATIERAQRSGRVSLKDGREFEFAAVPLPDGNALFTMLDVTASRTVEAALRERAEALEEADRLKTAFVSNMSYELRTPLTSIAGFAEMLSGGYGGELPPTASDYVGAILESVARLGALIDDVLDLTQSDSGSLLLAEEDVDLASLCGEAAEVARALGERRSIEFAEEIAQDLGRLTGDRRRLGQALGNILRNAFAYTPEGGRVLLHAERKGSTAEITVSDNGRGIPKAQRSIVFDRFHRTPAAEGGEQGSLGLGLPLARQFVEAHGGTIALVSEEGEGTSVTIALPVKE